METNKFSSNHFQFFFNIFIILKFSIYFSLSINIGEYPYTKRLNNGNYIILSSTNIAIVDSTLTIEINNIDLQGSVYSERADTYSTIAEQFLERDDEYIVAILKQTIYIFSKEGELLKQEYISSINQQLIHSIVPISHTLNNYYFAIIFLGTESSSYDKIIIRKYTFNSNSNTLTLNSQDISFETKDSYNNAFIFLNSISCKLMFYNSNNIINCIYINDNNLGSTLFNADDNFNTISSKPTKIISSPSTYCKIEVIPGKREDAIICNYHTGMDFVCRTYNILSHNFGNNYTIGNNQCNQKPTSIMIEYFYETEEVIVGCTGYYLQLTLAKFTNDLTFENLTTIERTIPNDVNLNGGEISRTNIIFPSNQNKYGILVGVVCSGCSQKTFLETYDNIEVEILNTYYHELKCDYYFNYAHNDCIEEIPPGYYCNSTEKKNNR